jgi:hypothetical protein
MEKWTRARRASASSQDTLPVDDWTWRFQDALSACRFEMTLVISLPLPFPSWANKVDDETVSAGAPPRHLQETGGLDDESQKYCSSQFSSLCYALPFSF